MRKHHALLLFLSLTLLAVAPATADRFQTFSGSTVGGPTWNRPNGAGPGLSGNNVRYRTQTFILQSPSVCTIYSIQDFDGYLHLYQGSFNPANQLNNLMAGDDDAELGVGTSRIPADMNTANLALAAGTYILVTGGFVNSSVGSFETMIQCNGSIQPIQGGCFFGGFPREQQVCLHDRFAVKVDQVTNHPTDGRATPVRFGSTDSGFFWFFSDQNFEVMVKVLNACAVNNHWWVFIAATTNQGHRIQVGDVTDGMIRTYTRPLGPPAAATTDVVAFDCP